MLDIAEPQILSEWPIYSLYIFESFIQSYRLYFFPLTLWFIAPVIISSTQLLNLRLRDFCRKKAAKIVMVRGPENLWWDGVFRNDRDASYMIIHQCGCLKKSQTIVTLVDLLTQKGRISGNTISKERTVGNQVIQKWVDNLPQDEPLDWLSNIN